MKNILIILVVSAILLPFSLSAQIKWDKSDYRKVLVKAKVLERNIVLSFHSTNPDSIRLNHEVFLSKTGKRLSDEFFCLNYTPESKEAGKLIKQFNIITFPQVLLLDNSGNEIDRVIHYNSAGNLVKTILDFSMRKGDINSLEKHLASNPKDIKALYLAGEKYAYRGVESKANNYLGKVVELDPKNSKGYSDKALFTLAKYLYLINLKNYSRTLSLYLELENLFSSSPYAKRADLERANVYMVQKKKKQAFSSLQSYILKNKSDKSAKPHLEYAKFSKEYDFHINEGLEIAKEGVTLNPKADELYDTMAELYSNQKEFDKAVNAIRKAIEITLSDPHYKNQLNKFLKEKEKVKTKKQISS